MGRRPERGTRRRGAFRHVSGCDLTLRCVFCRDGRSAGRCSELLSGAPSVVALCIGEIDASARDVKAMVDCRDVASLCPAPARLDEFDVRHL